MTGWRDISGGRYPAQEVPRCRRGQRREGTDQDRKMGEEGGNRSGQGDGRMGEKTGETGDAPERDRWNR